MTATTRKLPHLLLLVIFLIALVDVVKGQGCANTCPPINFGTPVPSLCEGDLAAESSANIDKEYTVCHPTPDTFRFTDFLGAGRVTVLSNVYIGCNAVRAYLKRFENCGSVLLLCLSLLI